MALGWLFLLLSTREPANQYMGTTPERQLRRSQLRLLTRHIFNGEGFRKATSEAAGFRMGLTSCRGRLPLPSTMPSSDSYLIVGGGLLGGHIVDLLLQRGEKAVAVFDLKPSSFDTPVKVYQGDIADPDAVGKAIKAVGSAFLIALLSIRLPATLSCPPVKSYLYHSDRGGTPRAASVRSRQSQHRGHEERHRTSPKIWRSEICLDELGERSFRR